MKLRNGWVCVVAFAALAACSREATQLDTQSDPAIQSAQSSQPMTVVARNDLNWLVANSPFVFLGRVARQSSEQDRRGLIVTKNEFAIDRVIVGDETKRTVALTTLGGSVGDVAMKASHMPEFAPNTSYVVFTDLARTVYNPITGNERGVFVVTDGRVYAHDGLALAGVENGTMRFAEPSRRDAEKSALAADDPKADGAIVSVERSPSSQEPAMALDAFVTAIQSAARK